MLLKLRIVLQNKKNGNKLHKYFTVNELFVVQFRNVYGKSSAHGMFIRYLYISGAASLELLRQYVCPTYTSIIHPKCLYLPCNL